MLLKMSKAARILGLGAGASLHLDRMGSQQSGTLVERHVFGWQGIIGLAFSPQL